VNTITNHNLQIDDPDTWQCTPLKQLELTAKAVYYITRTLRSLELL